MAVVFVLGDGTEVAAYPSPLVRMLATSALAAGLRDATLAHRLIVDAPAAACEILAGLLTRAEEAAAAPPAPEPPPGSAAKKGRPVVSILSALGPSAKIEEGPPRGE